MYDLTQKQWECLQANSEKFQKALLKLVPEEKRKKATQILGDIIDMEIKLEANCNK